jgi:HEAT repeat protein
MNTNLRTRILQMVALLALAGCLTAFKWARPAETSHSVVTPASVGNGPSIANAEREIFIDNMIKKMTDPDFTVRRCAARALGRIGRSAQKAVPALLCALGDEDSSVREAAAIALDRIDPTVRALSLARNTNKE